MALLPVRRPAAVVAFLALASILAARPAVAVRVTHLAALHRDGQTFLTWTSPPEPVWAYRIYQSAAAIEYASDLQNAELLEVVSDSTWCDRRLSSQTGVIHGFAVDSLAAPLDSTRGLFVWTAATPAASYYAVTCQLAGSAEDLVVVPGENALADPVDEVPDLPRPVYQRTLVGPYDEPADVYTLWTTNRDTPFMRAMSTRAGDPHDCSVHRGSPGGGLLVQLHVRGGSFYLAQIGTGAPGEWQVTMDDFLPTPDVNTFWFGYHEHYDAHLPAPQPPPVAGVVKDFTARRLEFTLEWARRSLAVDTSRVYVEGNSMGAIGSVFLTMWRPDLVAATMAHLPLFDFSFNTDPNPACAFNEGGSERVYTNRLWGTVGTGLTMEDGTRVYDRLNAGAIARTLEAAHVPPMITFSGRYDVTLGWAEKIPFYRAMRESRAGGMFLWDMRSHVNTRSAGAWFPMETSNYLYRFRTNRSFPALSNCSADGDPGDGHATDGDSIGTINGFAEWDILADDPDRWRTRLWLRNLTSNWGPVTAPESVTVDVTPRRLQRFAIAPGRPYTWVADHGARADSGIVTPDSLGVLTVRAVKVLRTGTVFELHPAPVVGVEDGPARGPEAVPRIGPLPCPVRGPVSITTSWPLAGIAVLEVLDVAGRRVRTLLRGGVARGRSETWFDPGDLASGLYYIHARQGVAGATRRFVVVR